MKGKCLKCGFEGEMHQVSVFTNTFDTKNGQDALQTIATAGSVITERLERVLVLYQCPNCCFNHKLAVRKVKM